MADLVGGRNHWPEEESQEEEQKQSCAEMHSERGAREG